MAQELCPNGAGSALGWPSSAKTRNGKTTSLGIIMTANSEMIVMRGDRHEQGFVAVVETSVCVCPLWASIPMRRNLGIQLQRTALAL